MAVQNIKHMIETLILGIVLGIVGTVAGAAYAAYKVNSRQYMLKKFNSGYQLIAADLGFEGDPAGYVGLKKDGKFVMGVKFDDNGVTDIVYDI